MRRKVIKKNKNISKRIKSQNKKCRKPKDQPLHHQPLWDKDLNLRENFKNIGTLLKLNKVDKLDQTLLQPSANGQLKVEEEMTLEQISKINQNDDYVQSKSKITDDEKFIVQNLAKKYGTNFDKMMMDHKVNKLQWNPNQIQKKFDHYQRKYGTYPV